MSQPRLEEGGAGGTGFILHRSPKLLPIAHGQRLEVVVTQPQPQPYIHSHSQCGQVFKIGPFAGTVMNNGLVLMDNEDVRQ